jgi:hypothetical protein
LEFPFQVVVQVERHMEQEVTALRVVVEPTIRPMAVQELQDKDLLEESHREVVEAAVAAALAKPATPMAKVTVVTARSV